MKRMLPGTTRPGRGMILSVLLLLGACAPVGVPPESFIAVAKPQEIVGVATASVTVAPQTEVPAPTIARVVAQPQDLQLEVGSSAVLGATAYDEQNQRLLSARTNWHVIDVRAGRVNAQGVFTAGEVPGYYRDAIQVTASLETSKGPSYRSTSLDVTVVGERAPVILQRVEVIPARVKAAPGQIVRLQALGYDTTGRVVPEARFTWSLTRSVGRIDRLGFFTAAGSPGTYPEAIVVEGHYGQATVTARLPVDIVESPATVPTLTVQILPRQIEIAPGESFRFRAVAMDLSGRPLPEALLRWRTDNAAAGEVGPDGSFRAGATEGVYVGAVAVEANYLTGRQRQRTTALASVIVRTPPPPSPLTSVRVRPGSVVLLPGEGTVLGAAARDERGLPAKGVSFQWAVVDPRAGTMEANGRFTASMVPGRYAGALHLLARQNLGDRTIMQEAYADVLIPGELARVEIVPTEAIVAVGGTLTFSARGFDGLDIEIPGLVFRWRVLNARAGYIDPLGNFLAGDLPGDYPDVVQVTAVQRLSF